MSEEPVFIERRGPDPKSQWALLTVIDVDRSATAQYRQWPSPGYVVE